MAFGQELSFGVDEPPLVASLLRCAASRGGVEPIAAPLDIRALASSSPLRRRFTRFSRSRNVPPAQKSIVRKSRPGVFLSSSL